MTILPHSTTTLLMHTNRGEWSFILQKQGISTDYQIGMLINTVMEPGFQAHVCMCISA